MRFSERATAAHVSSVSGVLAAFCVLVTGVSILASSAQAQVASSTAFTADREREIVLEKQLAEVDQEIRGLTNTVSGLKNEKASLGRDIKLLSANISKATLSIQKKNLEISRLGSGIAEKERIVARLDERIERERKSLAQLIRRTNEIDQASLEEVLLSDGDISDFFLDLDAFDAIRASLKDSTDALRSAKTETEQAQADLEERKNAELDARAEMERNKRVVESNEREKQQLLKITSNKEKEYQRVLDDRKKRAAEIRAALFALRDSGEIQFGKALDYATVVAGSTGIRPAFLLAIFQQESSFGKNQGSCYLKDPTTGSGVGANTGRTIARVMKPDRDVQPFLRITAATGRDPYQTRVSCPQEVGYGGAMGPAQFIPSTWEMFDDRIMKALGTSMADPWSARDAFMAAGIYLADMGANTQSYSKERDAACRYFSGKTCAKSSWAATYGDQVMRKAATIQETMIDPLQNT
jgi:membrane-bound lytic murein transglycosylase B